MTSNTMAAKPYSGLSVALASMVALTSVLAGCKVTLQMPDYGGVTSENYTCEAGQHCEIDIATTQFDETFRAVPESGYEFVGWVSGNGYLCGGNNKPCNVNTLWFAGNAELEELLDDDINAYLAPQFRRVEGLESPALQSSFGGFTQVDDSQPLYGDITGEDFTVSWPNRWDTDLEAGNPFNAFRLYFEGGTQSQRRAEIKQELGASGNSFLRFQINEPNVVLTDRDGIACNRRSHKNASGNWVPEKRKSRIQAVLRDTPNLKAVDYEVRLRLGAAFAAYVNSPYAVRWMTLAEVWNDLPDAIASPDARGFRISLAAWKTNAAIGEKFHWYVHAQTQSTTVKGEWDDVWKSEETHAPVAIPTDGEWVTLRVSLLEGDAATGRALITVTDESGWTQTIVDKTGWTRHPQGSSNGFEAINPLKLYTNGDYVCGLQWNNAPPLIVDWDDFTVGGSVYP